MELGKTEVNETAAGTAELDFDPDKLIGGTDNQEHEKTNDADELPERTESALHDPEQLAQPVEGLAETQQGTERLDNGNTVFDHPRETGERLNSNQGEAVSGFSGTCGLVSAENVARLAGKDVSEADVIGLARANGDCTDHMFFRTEDNGASTSKQIANVLGHLGIEANVDKAPSCDKLANSVESGRGVIACVDASKFWSDWPYGGGHAVTVTSVERNTKDDVVAFYVCDSGTGGEDSCRRVEAGTLSNAIWEAVVTEKPIW